MDKKELEALLNYHDDLYYNQDNPEISDQEYDTLKNEYVALYGEYDYVPGSPNKDAMKFKHTTNVSSLDKLQIGDIDGLRREISRLWPVIIQDKFDGLTMVSYPSEEHVTRGNGKTGEIITKKVEAGVNGVGEFLDRPVRSEVVMLKSEFNRINQERVAAGLEPFKNTRNAAAGMLRNKDITKVEGLLAFAYNIIYEEKENNNSFNQIVALEQHGWNTARTYIPGSVDEAIEYILNYDRDALDYDIDGLVIKHNGPETFGYTGHHPKGAIAVKFEAEGQWTKLNRIVWQVGRTGKITPVGEFDPVDIAGSTINRATLHNISIIQALGLNHISRIGKFGESITEVYVIKSNDVIPAITQVRQPALSVRNVYTQIVHEPSNCPVCHGAVTKVNDQLFCCNENCPARIVGRLVHMAQRDAFNIEGLSDETAKKLVDLYIDKLKTILTQMQNTEEVMTEEDEDDGFYEMMEEIEYRLNNIHPSFIYELNYEDLLRLDGFAEKSAKKLYDAIQGSLNIDLDKFIYGAGMPLVGKKASNDIAKFYYRDDESAVIAFAKDYQNKFKALHAVRGIGEEIINSLVENYESMLMPFGEYNFTVHDIKPDIKAANQLTFVITGEFPVKRKEIESYIKESGHKVTGSVSKKTNYLLASPGEENTTKYKKAMELNINIIHTIDELEEIIDFN